MDRIRSLRQFNGLVGMTIRRAKRRRPPRGSAPALVEPPRGPLPLQGGAEAPLAYDS